MSMMKSRLSFVGVRRPSTKPGETLPSPRGQKEQGGGVGGDDGPPVPELLASPEVIPRPSLLGVTKEVPLQDEGPKSPNFNNKTRSKSVLDLKKKASTLDGGNGGGAEEIGEDGETKQIFPASVREGFLKKKGVVNLSWKKRYLVLLPHQLAYYDEIPSTADAIPKGFINLTSILKVEHHDSNSGKDFTFDVVTPTRIFRLQAESQADMDAWIASISGTAANEQQILASRRRNVSHAAVQIRTLTEEDRLKADDSARISHELAELRNWANWNSFEVAAWLQTFGMARYSPDFYKEGINGEKCKTLDDQTLVNLGIDEKADRIKILAQIKKLMQDSKRS